MRGWRETGAAKRLRRCRIISFLCIFVFLSVCLSVCLCVLEDTIDDVESPKYRSIFRARGCDVTLWWMCIYIDNPCARVCMYVYMKYYMYIWAIVLFSQSSFVLSSQTCILSCTIALCFCACIMVFIHASLFFCLLFILVWLCSRRALFCGSTCL
jgi:hypothetical protein